MTIVVDADLVVEEDEVLTLVDRGFALANEASLTVAGAVIVNTEDAASVLGVFALGGASAFAASQTTITETGSLRVGSEESVAVARGFAFNAASPGFSNAGSIFCASAAWAVAIQGGAGFDFANSGDLTVIGGQGARAVSAPSGGNLSNSGTIAVDSGSGIAVGMALVGAGAVLNTGEITVVNQRGRSIGVDLIAGMDADVRFENRGTINALIALRVSSDPESETPTVLLNSGTMNGFVWLGDGAEHFTNTGRLTNGISLGGGDDVYDGRGGVGHTSISGGAGDDVLMGGRGHDWLFGGAGADRMDGGDGGDRYYVDHLGDRTIDTGSSGRDHVFADISWRLDDGIEALSLGGRDQINGIGNDADNILIGNERPNVLVGMGGSDSLSGGAGADRFAFNAVSESSFEQYDRIMDLRSEDYIDLRKIDADTTTPGDDAFTRVDAFSGRAGELMMTYYPRPGSFAVDFTFLLGDVNGDGRADLRIYLQGDHRGFDHILW